MLRKLRAIRSWDRKTFCFMLEALFYLGWARLLILLPFSKIAPQLGQKMLETTFEPTPSNHAALVHIHNAIQSVSGHTLWESKCLVRAIAGLKMLEKRRIESTLYLGTAKDEAGNMIAHAWLRSGPYYITGSEGMEKFTVVGKFAKTMNND